MRFLADMGVDQQVVAWLRAAGHDAIHLRDEGLHRLPDDDIFDKAIAEARIILTFDLDFGKIAALASGRVASVIPRESSSVCRRFFRRRPKRSRPAPS